MAEKSCSVIGCLGKYYAKGFCELHYQRNKKHGSPDDRKGHHVPVEKKFWNTVDKDGPVVGRLGTPCWVWTGFKRKGYGGVWINGKNVRAHRAAWEMLKGDIPSGCEILHKCDNPSCVNPEHLYLGTHIDNMRDKVERNRCAHLDRRGENGGRSKLTNTEVLEIRADSRIYKDIAKSYGVDSTTICNIKKRKTWNHI